LEFAVCSFEFAVWTEGEEEKEKEEGGAGRKEKNN
jgi:hypothetical protein